MHVCSLSLKSQRLNTTLQGKGEMPMSIISSACIVLKLVVSHYLPTMRWNNRSRPLTIRQQLLMYLYTVRLCVTPELDYVFWGKRSIPSCIHGYSCSNIRFMEKLVSQHCLNELRLDCWKGTRISRFLPRFDSRDVTFDIFTDNSYNDP